jgi:ferredoxin
MAVEIVDRCVNCFACMLVCPNEAIYESKPHFMVHPHKCTECEGDFDTPQCATICPVEEAILDAKGAPLNPLGTLTGIPRERFLELEAKAKALAEAAGATAAAGGN